MLNLPQNPQLGVHASGLSPGQASWKLCKRMDGEDCARHADIRCYLIILAVHFHKTSAALERGFVVKFWCYIMSPSLVLLSEPMSGRNPNFKS